MTALANLAAKWLANAATCRADAERLGEGNPVHNELLRDAAQYEQCAHALQMTIATLSPAELGGVVAKAIYDPNSGRASDVDQHDWPNSAGFINVLLVRADEDTTPRADEAEWLPTNGREPEGWRNHRLMFLCWDDGTVEASECYGFIAWEETTHWMPAKKPAKPPSPGAAK